MDSQLPQCPIHLGLKQVFYCIECAELLCRKCMMDNHRLHNYDETDVVIKKRNAAVYDLLEPAEQLLTKKAIFSEKKAKLAAYHKELEISLMNQFERVRMYVGDREKFLLACLQNTVEREHAKIDGAEKEFTLLTLKFQSTIANARTFLKESIGISLIAEGKQLSRDLEGNIESMNKICDPVLIDDKCVEVVFSDEENISVKGSIDKLGTLVENKISGKTPILTSGCNHDNAAKSLLLKKLSLPVISLPSQFPTSDHMCKVEGNSSILQPAAIISCTEKGKKFYPCGIAVGSNNLITVSDLHSNFVKVLTGTGKVIDTIQSSSKGSCHTLRGPCALNVDKENDIYILERDSKSIGKYTNGSLVDIGKFNKQFDDPRGILVFRERVYITDWKKNCIHVLTLVCNRLVYQSAVGESYLKQPAGIACNDRDEKIVVCDQENHCIWVLTPEGNVINVIGEKGNRLGMLNVPYGVAVTGDGKVVVSEKGNCRISVFSLDGSHLFSFGSKGSHPGQFNQLRHICTNFNKQILVADELNQRVQIFDI